MRVGAEIEIAAPRAAVWEAVADPNALEAFMHGFTRWQPAVAPGGGAPSVPGLGARYRTLMRVGSAQVGGLVEIVEWHPPGELAWASLRGVDQRGRFRLRERGPGATHVELRLAYGVAGAGLLGWTAEQVAAPMVRTNLRRSLQQLKRRIEGERSRRGAAVA